MVTGELDRMNRFVEDLLLLAKAESPDFLQLETVPLEALADELVSKARGMADRRWVLDAASRRSIVADRQRLTQAVMNLAQNAVAHTEGGDEIGIGASANGDEAAIWVRDTGVGIPAGEQRRIFSRFSRGVHSRGRYEGTGIGLAIVRAIAALARTLEIGTAAEGIENEAQLARLLALGVEEWQGHYFSAPLDAAGFGELLSSDLLSERTARSSEA